MLDMQSHNIKVKAEQIKKDKRGIERYEKPYELRSILKHSN